MSVDAASQTLLISASWLGTNTPDKPAVQPWSCSCCQQSKQRVIFLKTPHSSSFREILIVQQRNTGKKVKRGKKKKETAWPLIFFLPAFCSYWRQLLEIQIFSPTCKVKLHSDERDKNSRFMQISCKFLSESCSFSQSSFDVFR